MSTKTISADIDPELLNSLAEKATQEKGPASPLDDSSLELPDCHLTLPGGYLTMEGEVFTDAEVRELNGADEEAIAKAPNVGRVLITVLERGIVSIGPHRITKEILDELLAGDRDALLLAIRRATFGDTVTYEITCNKCGAEQDVKIDLKDDLDVVTMTDPTERTFTVKCRTGEVTCSLPTGRVQRDLMLQPDKTVAEQATLLLGACVMSVNDMPSMGVSTVKKLGIRDREKILAQIAKRNPGPRLTSVKAPCMTCEEELAIQVTMADLFRF